MIIWTLPEWADLVLRWFHVMAGISWIGGSLYLLWLARILKSPERARRGEVGEPWVVDLTGALLVDRLGPNVGEQERTHHWFKRETALTWLSGIVLLVAGPLASGANVGPSQPVWVVATVGTAATFALFALCWWGYDRLWASRLAGQPLLASGISLSAFSVLAWSLASVVPGRSLYIMTGALLGTMMALNVWIRVLPALAEMSAARRQHRAPDDRICALAHLRSTHNSYLMFPTVVLMLGNHFPTLHGHPLNWLTMVLVVTTFIFARHVVATGGAGKWALLPALASFTVAIAIVGGGTDRSPLVSADSVSFSRARAVIFERCQTCHSSVPSDRRYPDAPGGIAFDDPAVIASHASRIRTVTVGSRTMPPRGTTAITENERAVLGRWVDQGARLE